ncbi:MAG: hypothetical protein HY713_13510 [candidate division NC10 bacterium]|nr:hypothetical protein [candidate division NC10 bacterium]
MAGPGCPICARVLQAGREVLITLLAEPSSGIPEGKKRFPFRGLCNTHAWSIHQIPQKPVGLTDNYEVFLRGRIETLQRLIARAGTSSRSWWTRWIGSWGGRAWAWLPPWRSRRRCPACRAAGAMEQRDLGLLLDVISDMEFARAFETSAGLCLPHLSLILRVAPDHSNLPKLLEAHILKAKRLHAGLQDFLRQAKAPLVSPTQEEQDAIWGRLLEWTVGKAGVFGPERDLAPGVDTRRLGFSRVEQAGGRRAYRTTAEEGDGRRMDEVERLSLENAKLERRLVEVSREWAEESARRAALQFQVHKLTEDVKVLELNLAGARGEAKSGEIQAGRLRKEIEALQEEIRRLGGKEEDPTGTLEDGR